MPVRIVFFSIVFSNLFFCSISRSQVYKVEYVNFSDQIMPAMDEVTHLLLTSDSSINWTVPYKYYSTLTKRKISDSRIIYMINSPADTLKRFIYKNRKDQSMVFESRLPFVYKKMKVIEDTLNIMRWSISNESKSIINYKCTKASTFFRGRKYIAWFALDVPISDGPWKFSGLPGLILEVYDEEKKFFWTVSKLEKTNVVLPVFPENTDGTFPAFKLLYQDMFAKFKKSLEAKEGVSNPDCKGCVNNKVIEFSGKENLLDN